MTARDVPLVPLYLIWPRSVMETTTQSHSLHSWYSW